VAELGAQSSKPVNGGAPVRTSTSICGKLLPGAENVTYSGLDSAPEGTEVLTLSVWEMNNLLAKLTVAEIMTREPTTISQEATISTVAEIMLEKKFSGLPVVDDFESCTAHVDARWMYTSIGRCVCR
jgi:CBS domain-containing protein